MKVLFILFHSFLYANFDKDGPKINDLDKWIGKMPFQKIDGYSLMSSKELMDEVTKIIGPSKIKEFLKVKTQGVVKGGNKNGFITFRSCHGYCGFHYFHTYINTQTREIYICETISDEKLQRIWYGYKGKVEFNNLTKENMIYCGFPNSNGKIGVNWQAFLDAIPKEIGGSS